MNCMTYDDETWHVYLNKKGHFFQGHCKVIQGQITKNDEYSWNLAYMHK